MNVRSKSVMRGVRSVAGPAKLITVLCIRPDSTGDASCTQSGGRRAKGTVDSEETNNALCAKIRNINGVDVSDIQSVKLTETFDRNASVVRRDLAGTPKHKLALTLQEIDGLFPRTGRRRGC